MVLKGLKFLGNRKLIKILSLLVLVISTLTVSVLIFFSAGTSDFSLSWKRMVGSFSCALLGRTPAVYFLYGEKNGVEFRSDLKAAMEVSSADEFVIKGVITDVLFGRGVWVEIPGVVDGNCIGKLLKGSDFVKKSMDLSLEKTGSAFSEGAFKISVRYAGKEIGFLPVKVIVKPQDVMYYTGMMRSTKEQIEYLKKLLEADPGRSDLRKLLASLYVKAGEFEEASRQFRLILMDKPDDRGALMGLAETEMARGGNEEAIKHFKKLLSLNPHDEMVLAGMATAYRNMHQWEQAVYYYQESLRLAPHNRTVRILLAETFADMKLWDRAAEEYTQVLKADPENLDVMVALAAVNIKLKNYNMAINLYERAVKKRKDAAIYANLGLAYGAKGNVGVEIENYRKALDLDPANAVVHYNLALALERQGKGEEAYRAFKKALELKPDDRDTLLKLAEMEMKHKNYGQAIVYYEKVMGKYGLPSLAYIQVAQAYSELKRYERAAFMYEKAVSMGIREPDVLSSLGRIYERLGKSKRGISFFEKYAGKNPPEEILLQMASFYVDERRYNEAIGIYERLLKRGSNKVSYYWNMGKVYGLKGDVDREIELYKKALRIDAEDDSVWVSLGEAYERKGMVREALECYVKAYEYNPESVKAMRRIPVLRIKLLEEKQGKGHEKN